MSLNLLKLKENLRFSSRKNLRSGFTLKILREMLGLDAPNQSTSKEADKVIYFQPNARQQILAFPLLTLHLNRW